MQGFSTIHNRRSTIAGRRRGFTLVEMLVVIGIIALLLAVAFPTLRRIRIAGQEADTRAFVSQLDTAIAAYHTTYQAYPGPIPNNVLDYNGQSTLLPIRDGSATGPIINPGTSTAVPAISGRRVTASENLVLGLCGGLNVEFNRATTPATITAVYYDVGGLTQGPANFNPLRPGRNAPFMQTANLSHLSGNGQVGDYDTIIPEFLDRFGDPQPIIYMRSRNNGQHVATPTVINTLVTATPADATNPYGVASDFSLFDALPYTVNGTGGLKTATPTATLPASGGIDAYPYLTDPDTLGNATRRSRKKESYVLISPGRDRLYGTADDVTNFGAVRP